MDSNWDPGPLWEPASGFNLLSPEEIGGLKLEPDLEAGPNMETDLDVAVCGGEQHQILQNGASCYG